MRKLVVVLVILALSLSSAGIAVASTPGPGSAILTAGGAVSGLSGITGNTIGAVASVGGPTLALKTNLVNNVVGPLLASTGASLGTYISALGGAGSSTSKLLLGIYDPAMGVKGDVFYMIESLPNGKTVTSTIKAVGAPVLKEVVEPTLKGYPNVVNKVTGSLGTAVTTTGLAAGNTVIFINSTLGTIVLPLKNSLFETLIGLGDGKIGAVGNALNGIGNNINNL